jgi:uncharacterized membrane-anchored protein YitT (DUF2179 family)
MIIFGPVNTMWAIISIFICTRVTDMVISGNKTAKATYIISSKPQEVSRALLDNIQRGITALPARGVYSNKERDILLCILNQKELVQAKEIVKSIDSKAFIVVTPASEVLGEGFEPLGKTH